MQTALDWGKYFEVQDKLAVVYNEIINTPGTHNTKRRELFEKLDTLREYMHSADPRPRVYLLQREDIDNDGTATYQTIGYYSSYKEAEAERIRNYIDPEEGLITPIPVGAIPDHP